MKRIITFIIGIILITTIVFGIVEKDNEDVDNIVSKDLVYSIDSITTNYEKVTGLSKGQENIITAISRGLVYKDSSGNIVTDLAESYEERDNGIEYRFKLKNDIYWSDGSKITSQDICDFFKELIKFEDKENIEALFNVYGVDKYKNGEIYFNDGVAIRAEENEIIFRLNEPNSDFISELSKIQYRIKKSLPLWSELDEYYKDIIYSGYFYIENYSNEFIKLHSNSKYSSKDVYIKVVRDENEETAMAAFKVGKRDIIINPPSNTLEELNKNKVLVSSSGTEGLYLILNSNNNDLNLSTRMSIYKNMCEALKEYENNNSMFIELAEGSYLLRDKDDLTKLQTRRVGINSAEEKLFIKIITLCAIDNDKNRSICKYISKWFYDNKNININLSFISKDDFNKLNLDSGYDLYLVNKDFKDNKSNLFSSFLSFFNGTEKSTYNVEKNINQYNDLEEMLFSNVRIVPLAYLKTNIGISDKKYNIAVDYYGNINFSELLNK